MVTQNTNKTGNGSKNTVVVKRFHFLDGNGRIKAFADILVDDVLLIKGCRIIQGEKGSFVSFPNTLGKNERYYSIVDVKDEKFAAEFQQQVLEQYEAAYAKYPGRNYQE